MRKRTLALVLALVLVLSLTACGGYSEKVDGTKVYTFVSSYHEDNLTGLPADFEKNTLDPRHIYDSAVYTPEMFYGAYHLADANSRNKEAGKAAKDLDTFQLSGELNSAQTYTAAVIPVGMEAGPSYCMLATHFPNGALATVYFYDTGSDSVITRTCFYEVAEDTITFKPLLSYGFEEGSGATKTFSYELAEDGITCGFRFDGIRLTFTSGGDSITLTSADYLGRWQEFRMIGGYVKPGTERLDGMLYFSGTQYDSMLNELFMDSASCYLDDGVSLAPSIVRMYEDGRISIYWQSQDGQTHCHHLVYFGTNPTVLTDGARYYYYTESFTSYNSALLGDTLADEDKEAFGEMSEDQQQAIVDKKDELLENMDSSYGESGLDVNVDKSSGEITMDATILFEVDQATLSDEGKEFLKEFVRVYTDVALGGEYDGFLSKIIVEGHTDPSGHYEYNKKLSQARAEAVLEFCLSKEAGLDAASARVLEELLVAEGYASDKPVLDEDGNVDYDASRRVSFRFIISIQ